MAEVKFSALGFAYLDIGIKPLYTQTMQVLRYKVDTAITRAISTKLSVS